MKFSEKFTLGGDKKISFKNFSKFWVILMKM